jgi:hypothetical protein
VVLGGAARGADLGDERRQPVGAPRAQDDVVSGGGELARRGLPDSSVWHTQEPPPFTGRATSGTVEA